MKVVNIEVYSFSELSDKAKEVAIENFKETQDVDLDFFFDEAKEDIEKAGFYDDVKLQYSLSYSQGDGLSFSCKGIKSSVLLSFFAEVLGKNKEKTAKIILQNCIFENKGNTGSHCFASEGDISFDLNYYGTNYNKDNIDAVVLQVEKKIQNLYINLCNDLEKQGYADLEYQESDEAITEIIEANDYEFTIDGNKFNN